MTVRVPCGVAAVKTARALLHGIRIVRDGAPQVRIEDRRLGQRGGGRRQLGDGEIDPERQAEAEGSYASQKGEGLPIGRYSGASIDFPPPWPRSDGIIAQDRSAVHNFHSVTQDTDNVIIRPIAFACRQNSR